MTTEITALNEREILALAISLEEEDARIYRDLAEKVRVRFPGTASILDSMRDEETSHRTRLHEFYLSRFGDHVLYLRRQEVKGFLKRRPLWLHPAPKRGDSTKMQPTTRLQRRCGRCSMIWPGRKKITRTYWSPKSSVRNNLRDFRRLT